jgi:small redox-active disulfide protein 2
MDSAMNSYSAFFSHRRSEERDSTGASPWSFREGTMMIEVFGPGCHRCQEVEKAVMSALSELNIPADVEKVNDITKIVGAGIMHTPGLRINGKIKCSGRIPKTEEVKKWIA